MGATPQNQFFEQLTVRLQFSRDANELNALLFDLLIVVQFRTKISYSHLILSCSCCANPLLAEIVVFLMML